MLMQSINTQSTKYNPLDLPNQLLPFGLFTLAADSHSFFLIIKNSIERLNILNNLSIWQYYKMLTIPCYVITIYTYVNQFIHGMHI
jgi:hypothetical protein